MLHACVWPPIISTSIRYRLTAPGIIIVLTQRVLFELLAPLQRSVGLLGLRLWFHLLWETEHSVGVRLLLGLRLQGSQHALLPRPYGRLSVQFFYYFELVLPHRRPASTITGLLHLIHRELPPATHLFLEIAYRIIPLHVILFILSFASRLQFLLL